MGQWTVFQISCSLGVLTLLLSFSSVSPDAATPRIAIVGAGIGGASTSYYLRQHYGRETRIDIYEKGEIGGRVATVNINGVDVESGASIIHPDNQYMVNFSSTFQLGVRDRKVGQMCLFGGDEILLRTSSFSMLTMTKLFWRYGMSVVYLEDFLNTMLSDFSSIYKTQDSGYAFTTPELLLQSMSPTVSKMVKTTLAEYMKEREFDDNFIEELVMAAIQTNYGQTPDVHAFVGSVSLAGVQPGLWSVYGGNKHIPINLVERSKARVISGTVTQITARPNSKHTITYTKKGTKIESEEDYDIVIIATPLEDNQSNIKLTNVPDDFIKEDLKFHRTVATFVYGQLKTEPFKFGSKEDITKAILFTNASLHYKSFGMHESVAYRSEQDKGDMENGFGIWKVFSSRELTEEELGGFFSDIKQVEVVDWMAYPEYSSKDFSKPMPSFEITDRLYYVNAFEWAASTMETQVIAGRNVALLATNKWADDSQKINPAPTSKKFTPDEL